MLFGASPRLSRGLPRSSEAFACQEIFDDHDEDHSGRLSFDEIVKVIESLMAEQVADHGTVAMRIKTGQTKQPLDAHFGSL